MKRLFRKLAVLFVTAHSRRIYATAVRCAEHKHGETGRRVFVITNQEDSKELLILTDKEFLQIRRKLGIRSRDCTISTLCSQSWYHTANENGRGVLREQELEIRKRAFIKDSLENAGLI